MGKTSLVLRFCRDTFTEGQPPTIQASCLERALRLGDRTVNLVIWDTAGQERFHALGPIYYRDADAALLVFDITDSDSFKRVHMWVRELRKMVRATVGPLQRPAAAAVCDPRCIPSSPLLVTQIDDADSQVGNEILLTIAGNKLDLERQRVVSKQEAADYAESVGALYCETSAKLGKGIDEVFSGMGKRLLQARTSAGAKRVSAGRSTGRTPMVLIDDELDGPGTGKSTTGCCS